MSQITTLSRDPEGDQADGLAPNLERLASFQVDKQTVELQLERIEPRPGDHVWVVSSDSVALIPKAHKAVAETPFEKQLPQVLVTFEILDTPVWRWLALVLIGPAKYNELYEKFGNLNKLLAWGHARVIENLLAKKPDCPRSLSDQFADARIIEQSLFRHAKTIQIQQRPRAESDIAVAAASVVAREAFINWLERKSKELGFRLERGVSPSVKEAARKVVEMNGPDALREVAKVHFRTAHEIAPNDYPAPPERENWRKAP